jgi:hypothetical protein
VWLSPTKNIRRERIHAPRQTPYDDGNTSKLAKAPGVDMNNGIAQSVAVKVADDLIGIWNRVFGTLAPGDCAILDKSLRDIAARADREFEARGAGRLSARLADDMVPVIRLGRILQSSEQRRGEGAENGLLGPTSRFACLQTPRFVDWRLSYATGF